MLIDDDVLMLKALARALLHIDPKINVRTLACPAEFHSVLANFGTPDVIFCDYIMPECTGLEVLEMARSQCPQAVRCLLSGEVSIDFSVQVENLAHYYLAKPFTREQLTQVLTAASQLPKLRLSEKERVELGQITCLPILPEVLVHALQLLRSQPPELEKVAELITSQPQLAAKVIQVANSAVMGFASPIQQVAQAVFRLGAHLTETVVALYELDMLATKLPSKKRLGEINTRAMQKAALAKKLGEAINMAPDEAEMLQVACLLSGVGEICALQLSEHSFSWPLQESSTISAYLLTLWGFSNSIICAQLISHKAHIVENRLTLLHAAIHETVVKNERSEWHAMVQKALFDVELLDEIKAWQKEGLR